jgi:hypothetical protein
MITAILGFGRILISGHRPAPDATVDLTQVFGQARSPARFARLASHWHREPDGRLTLHWHTDRSWSGTAKSACEACREHD